jgi:diguanylate cyclase (GGDEF)-like protein/PAS domain S-box-containing protein
MTVTATLLTLALAGAYVASNGGNRWLVTRQLEGQLLDLRFNLRGAEPPPPDIALVLVDDASLRRFGRWPISRAVYADLVDRLAEGKAATIVFNLLFTEPEPALPAKLRQTLSALSAGAAAGPQSPLIGQLLSQAGPDDLFSAAIKRAGNVIIPFGFLFDAPNLAAPMPATASPPAPPSSSAGRWPFTIVRNAAGADRDAFLDARGARLKPMGILAPLPQIAGAAAGSGHLSGAYEPDSSLRYDYAAVDWDGAYYPSLPIRAVAAFSGVDWNNVQLRDGQQIAIGRYRIPLDAGNRLIVNYQGPAGTFASYSMVDVMDGRIPPQTFAGKLVLVGVSAAGVADVVNTPFDRRLPGVERYASIISRILHGSHLQRPRWVNLVNLAAILLLGALVTWTAPRINLLVASGIAAVSLMAWIAVCQLAFVQQHLWFNLLFPSITVIATFASIVLMRGIAEERRRRAAEVSLRRSEERYALAAQGANDGLWDWDLTNDHFYSSQRWHDMIGRDAAVLQGRVADWYGYVLADDLGALQAAVQAHLAGGSAHLEHEFRLRHADGSERWMLVRGLRITDSAGQPVRMAGSMTDITGRKQTEQQMLFDALFDRLTGLANRASLRERTEFALQMVQQDARRDALVAVIDLDRFKDINDSLGQGTGDKLLISVARALQQAVGVQDTLAHLGEDEYGVLRVFEGDAAAALDQLVGTLQQAVARPFLIDDRQIELTISIGLAIASEAQATSADALLADANLAVYRAKALGRARAVKFDPSMQQSALKRLDLVSDLRQAVAKGNELELFYQPIMRLQDGGIHGFEALIRWRHPQRGLVSPGDFIPLAEETGLIVEIGRRSIWQACRQIAVWLEQTDFAPQVAVNVSGRQLETEAIVDDIRQALAETAIPPMALKIEITESMVMDNPERAQALLARIVALGVKVSIDDFGTGYSSLSHLHRFPFHTLKIDRSFVIRLTEDREGFEICKAIAKLAHILRRDVVAEGIETTAQADLLRDLDVEFAQGYLFSRPLPLAEATVFLQARLLAAVQQPVSPL